MIDIVAPGRIEGGRLILADRQDFALALRQASDGDVQLTLSRVQDTRSAVANRYYFGVVLHYMSKESGHTKDELHDLMCDRFLRYRVIQISPVSGEVTEREIARRSSGLKVGDFYLFVEQVRQFAGEFYGIVTPDPDKDYQKHRERARAADAPDPEGDSPGHANHPRSRVGHPKQTGQSRRRHHVDRRAVLDHRSEADGTL